MNKMQNIHAQAESGKYYIHRQYLQQRNSRQDGKNALHQPNDHSSVNNDHPRQCLINDTLHITIT